MTKGSDGALYGTTISGGSLSGSIFKINQDGTGFQVLYELNSSRDGQQPHGPLIEGSDGLLYGTASIGGASGIGGTVFKLNKDGTGFTVLHSFGSGFNDDRTPEGGLLEGSDGWLYGTVRFGGGNGRGGVFKMRKDGAEYAIVYGFVGADQGSFPFAGVSEGSGGALFGTTFSGGASGKGTVFKLNKDGSGYVTLRSFTYSNSTGYFPYAELTEGSDGRLYGTIYEGGLEDAGTVFAMNRNGGGYMVLHHFTQTNRDGRNPVGTLLEASDGWLYGTTYAGGANNKGTIFKLTKDGTAYAVLHSFGASAGDGQAPYCGLTESITGALFGTTLYGGTDNSGTVFRLNKDGAGYAVLKSFSLTDGGGYFPYGRALEGTDGNFYSTTYSGGGAGFGVVFRISNDGAVYSVLRSFTGLDGDGENSLAGLFQGKDGWLYGTTQYGGQADVGTLFRLSTSGQTTVAPRLSGSYSFESGKFTLTVKGTPGAVVVIEGSSDLTDWSQLATVTNSTGQTQWTDDLSSILPQRFYRAKQLP